MKSLTNFVDNYGPIFQSGDPPNQFPHLKRRSLGKDPDLIFAGEFPLTDISQTAILSLGLYRF
jgi:hypothetical protein